MFIFKQCPCCLRLQLVDEDTGKVVREWFRYSQIADHAQVAMCSICWPRMVAHRPLMVDHLERRP